MSQRVYGDTSNLKASQAKALERLALRRLSPEQVVGPTLARDLIALSKELNRRLGLFVDRRGGVERVIVGTATAMQLPEFARVRGVAGRLRGVRLVVTHLLPDPLDREDSRTLQSFAWTVSQQSMMVLRGFKSTSRCLAPAKTAKHFAFEAGRVLPSRS